MSEAGNSNLDERTAETIRRIEEKWRRHQEEESNQRLQESRAKEEQEEAEEVAARSRWINFSLATIVTLVAILLTDRAIDPEADLGRSFGKYLGGAFSLQLLPLLFGWIARKVGFTGGGWKVVYWVILLGVLITRAVLLSQIAAL